MDASHQRTEALRRANVAKARRVALARELRELEREEACGVLAEVLRGDADGLGGMRIDRILRDIRGVGEETAGRVLSAALVRRAAPRLRDLTQRQRNHIADSLLRIIDDGVSAVRKAA